jgi:AcrR family transcriptional regulator
MDNYPATKKKIFFAACKLFSRKCYADVGVREIAGEAGVKVPTVYNHYPSKEAILEDLFQFYTHRIIQFYDCVDNIDFDREPVVCFKNMMFAFDESEIGLMRQLMRIVLNEQYRSAQAAKIVYDISLRKQKKSYYDFLSHLQNKGIIQCNAIDSLAEIFARVGITFAMQYVRDDEIHQRPDFDTVLMDLFELILHSSKPTATENATL